MSDSVTKTPLRTGRVTNSVWDAPPHIREKFKIIAKDFERRLGWEKCWLWPMKKNGKGYGEFQWYDARVRKRFGNSAPRVSLEIFLGRKLKAGHYPCHRCPGGPVKACFNPKHIWEDTMSENILDNYHGIDRIRDGGGDNDN